jgi:tyrosinase
VNLGPVAAVFPYIHANPLPSGLGYNPRCIVRDISPYVSTRWTKDSDIYDLIVGYTDIGSFQNRLQGNFVTGYFGVHSGGHYTSGGDPGGDFFTSPGDPYFFLHRE